MILADNAIVSLQDQVRQLPIELEWVKGFEHRSPHCRGFDHNAIDIAYSYSHKDREC